MIDEHNRKCLATRVHWSIRVVDVIRVVVAAMQRHGQDWLENERIETIYIKPGAPRENAYIESFHDKLRDEYLKRDSLVRCMRRA